MTPARNIKPKTRVVLENDKCRQTTHWDLDYLPWKEVDALHTRPSDRPAPGPSAEPPPQAASRRWGIACILAGLGLLGLAIAVARLTGG